MFNNVQIWVGGIWRRLIGQTNRGGAELGRGGEERWGHGSRQREVKQEKRPLFPHVKVNLVTTGSFGVSANCVCWNNGISTHGSVRDHSTTPRGVGVQVRALSKCCLEPSPPQGGTCCRSAWRLGVGIRFGSRLYVHKTSLRKLPAVKSFLSHLVVQLRLCCAVPGQVWAWSGVGGGCPILAQGGTNPVRWTVCLHVCRVCGSPLIQNMTRAKEQNKSLSKIAWDKDLENLLFISLKSPWRLLLLREEM